jgi:uncharacterized membrane protein
MMEGRRADRIQLIDAVRGLCVIMMVIHHLLYDLVVLLDAPEWLFTNPVFDFLHYIFAGLFILLSGVSSRFSRSNVKRGIKVIVAALAITGITYLIDMPIYFGVLHFLGFSMVFYGLTEKLLNKIPGTAAPFIYVFLLIVSVVAVRNLNTESKYLWMLGITHPDFNSADYFPIFPWVFVFLFGTWLGKYIKDRRFPKWFYAAAPPVLPSIGRKAFIIYLVHQPVLFGIIYGVAKLLDINR